MYSFPFIFQNKIITIATAMLNFSSLSKGKIISFILTNSYAQSVLLLFLRQKKYTKKSSQKDTAHTSFPRHPRIFDLPSLASLCC